MPASLASGWARLLFVHVIGFVCVSGRVSNRAET